MSLCLAFYDVTGIQKYIFMSQVLKENIGASYLVQNLLGDMLNQSIKKVVNDQCITEWDKVNEFHMLNPQNDKKAEIIYSGGGNAMVAYANLGIACEVNKELSRLILEKAQGLSLVVVVEEVDGANFYRDRKHVMEMANIKKREISYQYKLMGQSIEELCVQTKLPVCGIQIKDEDDQTGQRFIPEETYHKRLAYESEKTSNVFTFDSSRFCLPREFDKLGSSEGDSHIGVVHIDGNSMGQMVASFIKDEEIGYAQVVMRMRSLSKQINDSYRNAMQVVFSVIENSCAEGVLGDNIILSKCDQEEKNKYCLPLRTLIVSGDDVTFVTDGRIALPLAEIFLQEIDKSAVDVYGEVKKLSACAGVAVVKYKFPFYRAYEIAEGCCRNAKKRAKKMAGKKESSSWLDFQVVFSGYRNDLTTYRQINYIPAGVKWDGKKEDNGCPLLWRPWCVSANVIINNNEKKYDFSLFKKMIDYFKGDEQSKSWPRSKLKRLRSAYIEGQDAVDILLKEYTSRGHQLPYYSELGFGTMKDKGFDQSNITPYFDVLEMMDFWEPVKRGVN